MKIDLNKYLGKWFEIAQIQNEFEPNMKDVTATYELIDNGVIKITNRGTINGVEKEVTAMAFKTEQDDLLNVVFYPDISSSYRILAIDSNYQYALVGGDKPNYLWILSREKTIDKNTYNKFINIAKNKNYNVNDIILL